uniref:Site-specific recombinase n=1 Tax=Vibrio fluvialis TaxID=676 RepID=A0A1W6EUM1_VIBFL|nr:site-specific recombinase [Vibrio fluvialis]
MAKVTTRLTGKEIKPTKPSDKEYNLFDGDGLRLRIKSNSSKHWIFYYYRPTSRKQANLSLDKYPGLSLANTRKLTLEAIELLAQGINPQEERKCQQQEHKAVHQHTFMSVAKEWFEIKKHDVTPDYTVDIWRSIELHIFPSLADTPVK